MLSDLLSQVIESPKYAVLLNARAKRWTGDLHEQILRWVPAGDLFLSDDFTQAERTLDRIVNSDYDVIFTGGGDGTIMYLMNAIQKRIQNDMVKKENAPPAGVLKMGTGNALATYLGCHSIVDDLRTLGNGSPLAVYDLNMIKDAKNPGFPFAGFGWDALLLNDYDNFKESARQTPFENYVTGVFGYGISLLTRSIPNAVQMGAFQIRVTAKDDAEGIDQKGNLLTKYKAGDILYEGDARTVSIGSIENWGFSIRMFRHATLKSDYAQLRIFHGKMRNVMKRMDHFWKGQFRDDEISDFLVKNVDIDILSEPMPYHIAGDPCGYERHVNWEVLPKTKLAVVQH